MRTASRSPGSSPIAANRAEICRALSPASIRILVFSVLINVELPALDEASRQIFTIATLLSPYRNRNAAARRIESSHHLMIAFANEWGWWALPMAVAVAVGGYLWRSRLRAGQGTGEGASFLTVEEARRAWNSGQSLLFADVRSQSAYDVSATTISGAIRLHPARAVEEARARSIASEVTIVAFCA